MTQRDRYDLYGGIPPHVQTDTSLAAAISILESASTLRARVYRYIKYNPCVTDENIQTVLDMGANTERPRRRELVLMSVVEDSGQRGYLESGRTAILWRVVAHERQLAMEVMA